jgi:DNA polymerase I-like protein with 3'-5' exonuclease and polymerase domains
LDPPVVKKSLDDVTKDYVFPKTIEEVETLVNHIINYYNPERGTGPHDWYITLDTETNTLYPYAHPNPKVLMLTVSWDDGKGACFLLDHPDVPYDPAKAWEHISRLLRCPKPKAFHNWKFDQKFIEQLKGIIVNNVKWCTMLGEHYLDEDKKGHYRLKQLVPMYAPEYEGYDETLQNFLRGKEEDEERSAEEVIENGFLIEHTEVEPLYLADNELADFIITISINGVKTGRADEDWDSLGKAVAIHDTLSKIHPKKRDEEQKQQFGEARKTIAALRKKMRILRLDKEEGKQKKVIGSTDDGFQRVPLPMLIKYATADADVTRLILKKQVHRLQRTKLTVEANSVMANLYLPASRTLSRMEYRGFAVDQKYIDTTIADIENRLTDAEYFLHSKFDPTLNLNSPKQISSYMGRLNFSNLGTESGSTGKDSLERYMAMHPPDDARYQFCYHLLEFRECHKVLNTYFRPIKKFSKNDGKVHCSFNLNGTSTGRLSSARPNMQNPPETAARRINMLGGSPVLIDGKPEILHPGHNVKKIFVPSKPGNVIVNLDISGAEVRVYTVYSHDKKMIENINNKIDVHSWVTSLVHGIPYDKIQAEKESNPLIEKLRSNCKKVFFATLYGGGPRRVAQLTELPFEEAKSLQSQIFKAVPDLRDYVEVTTLKIQNRLMLTTVFGRCRRFRMAHVSSELMAEAIREGVNFNIQSTSSDLVLSQLCEIDNYLYNELQGELLITVHDSMVFEMPEDNLGKLYPFFDYYITQRIHEKFEWLPVDFLFDLKVGPSYGELKKFKR